MGRFPKQEHAILPSEVRLGRVNGVFGVQGEVRLFLHNRESSLFDGDGFDVTLVSPEGDRVGHRLRSRSGAGKRVLGRLDGVSTPDEARAYMDWEIVCPEDALPAPGMDEYYHRDLLGMAVHDTDGAVLGRLSDVLVGEVVDCWQIQTDDGELIIPAVKDVVQSVDVDGQVIVIKPTVDLEA